MVQSKIEKDFGFLRATENFLLLQGCMRTNSITSPSINQRTALPSLSRTQTAVKSVARRRPLSGNELSDIVSPLVTFLVANSSYDLLGTHQLKNEGRSEPEASRVEVRFWLDPRFLREQTVLDEPLMALLRASRRRYTGQAPIFDISLELRYGPSNPGNHWYTLDAELVISVNCYVERKHCLKHVSNLLRVIARAGYIRPLTDYEREGLGRSRTRSQP